jgi:hypothetical protein
VGSRGAGARRLQRPLGAARVDADGRRRMDLRADALHREHGGAGPEQQRRSAALRDDRARGRGERRAAVDPRPEHPRDGLRTGRPLRLTVLDLAAPSGAPLVVESRTCATLSMQAAPAFTTRINSGPWIVSYSGAADIDCDGHRLVGHFNYTCPEE